MSLFQCRRFQFFDLEKVDVDITVKENLKGSEVVCGAGGRGRIVIGDSDGFLHFISRQLESRKVAEAHSGGIIQIQQLNKSPYLITLGIDEPDSYSIKVWDEVSIDLDQNKTQLFLKRTLKLTRHKPTCFIAHENLNLLAVGFTDGGIHLYRGEYRRDKSIKPKFIGLDDEQVEVTGLSFHTMHANTIIFASTKKSVTSIDISNKDKEIKLQTDNKIGCGPYCSSISEEHFIVGHIDGVYCYTHEGRGPCFGFEGEKQVLYCFRGYLLIISKLTTESSSIIVFDTENKFVSFSSSLVSSNPIRVVVGEWGCFFLITSDGTLWQLKEKDLQTKMGVFYKKNHYDLAIKVAKSNKFDGDALADVYRKYGDHLYAKGDLDGAIREYCKTVGKLEASYVVRKYIDASRILNLLEYLEVVHKTGHGTPDLTTLLLNCLTKLKLNEKIELYVKDPSCDFLEPSTAIRVFRRSGMWRQAYNLAILHGLHGPALQILLEDIKEPDREELYSVLEKTIREENAEGVLRRHGHALVQLVGQADSKSNEGSKKIVRLLCESPAKRELVDLFIANKEILVPLLENICLDFKSHDGPLMNLLLEAYLVQWAEKQSSDFPLHEKILALLTKAPDCSTWDWARCLFACKKFNFSEGEIIAYEKLGLHNDLLAIRYSAAQLNSSLWSYFIETVRKYAKTKASIWKDAFMLITNTEDIQKESSECPGSIIEEVLDKLLDESLMEPLQILEKLCETNVKLGSVRTFLTKVLDREELEEDEREIKKMQEDIEAMKAQINNIKTKPSVFQGSRCNACMQKLEFPSVHFLCLHSFHQHCFESYAENEKDCPVCLPKNKEILGAAIIGDKPSRAVIDSEFALKLSTAKSNSFSVLADFFSKGIFEPEKTPEVPPPKKNIERVKGSTSIISAMGQSEGRMRLNEGTKVSSFDKYLSSSIPSSQSSSFGTSTRTTIVPPNVVATSVQFPKGNSGSSSIPPLQISIPKRKTQGMSITTASSLKNPFEEEFDEKNPFAEKVEKYEPKNPFEEEDNYDPSLNPFE